MKKKLLLYLISIFFSGCSLIYTYEHYFEDINKERNSRYIYSIEKDGFEFFVGFPYKDPSYDGRGRKVQWWRFLRIKNRLNKDIEIQELKYVFIYDQNKKLQCKKYYVRVEKTKNETIINSEKSKSYLKFNKIPIKYKISKPNYNWNITFLYNSEINKIFDDKDTLKLHVKSKLKIGKKILNINKTYNLKKNTQKTSSVFSH